VVVATAVTIAVAFTIAFTIAVTTPIACRHRWSPSQWLKPKRPLQASGAQLPAGAVEQRTEPVTQLRCDGFTDPADAQCDVEASANFTQATQRNPLQVSAVCTSRPRSPASAGFAPG
jgi:hypothetical protein